MVTHFSFFEMIPYSKTAPNALKWLEIVLRHKFSRALPLDPDRVFQHVTPKYIYVATLVLATLRIRLRLRSRVRLFSLRCDCILGQNKSNIIIASFREIQFDEQ